MKTYLVGVATGVCLHLWWPEIKAWIAGPVWNWLKAKFAKK